MVLYVQKDSRLERLLLEQVPEVQSKYRPTSWCKNPAVMTLVSHTLKKASKKVRYDPEVVPLPDGNELILKWHVPEDVLPRDQSRTTLPVEGERSKKPTWVSVLYLPGISGESQNGLANMLAKVVKKALFDETVRVRFATASPPGFDGHKLKVPKVTSPKCPAEVAACVDRVKEVHPQDPLVLVGLSAGALCICHYLAEAEEAAMRKVAGVFLVSCLWHSGGVVNLEKPGLNRMLDRCLANALLNVVKNNLEVFESSESCVAGNVKALLRSTSFREVNNTLMAPVHGLISHEEFLSTFDFRGHLHRIKVPVLAVNASDDPMQLEEILPLEEAMTSGKVAILVTKRGGHGGFIEGWLASTDNYLQRLFVQFLSAVVYDQDILQEDEEVSLEE